MALGCDFKELMRYSAQEPPTVGASSIGRFAVVAQDSDELRWIVDPERGECRHGDGDVEFIITGTAEALMQMIAGEVNPAVLLRTGQVRHLQADSVSGNDPVQILLEELRLLRRLVGYH